MKKLVSLTPLCFLILIVGCESFTKKDYEKTYKSDISSGETRPNTFSYDISSGETRPDTFSNEDGSPPKRSGYLASGSTVKVDTGEGDQKTSVLEQLEDTKKQLEAAQQIVIENERLNKQLNESREPYEKKIKELTMELTKAQIEETKAKQELIGLKIEQLHEKKKLKTNDSQ